jgi:hypothetical protein
MIDDLPELPCACRTEVDQSSRLVIALKACKPSVVVTCVAQSMIYNEILIEDGNVQIDMNKRNYLIVMWYIEGLFVLS